MANTEQIPLSRSRLSSSSSDSEKRLSEKRLSERRLVKKNPVKRGRGGNKSKESNKSLTILGNNVAGIRGKEDSLNQLINEIQPGVIMLQETKLYKQGKSKYLDT